MQQRTGIKRTATARKKRRPPTNIEQERQKATVWKGLLQEDEQEVFTDGRKSVRGIVWSREAVF